MYITLSRFQIKNIYTLKKSFISLKEREGIETFREEVLNIQ